MTYASGLATLTRNLQHIQPRLIKLQHFANWASMDLVFSKCAIIASPKKTQIASFIHHTPKSLICHL